MPSTSSDSRSQFQTLTEAAPVVGLDPFSWARIAATILAFSLVWATAQWLAQPNLDRYHDMLESFAWSQTFEWGSFKHPPFFAWVTGAWFALMPRTDFAFKLLAYANVGVGLLGVAALAKLSGLGRFALAAVVLLGLCLPYTTLAAKFNANAQLLSVWPWAAAALFGSLTQIGLRGFTWSTLLGLLGAAAMLSKYYSGVFLLALFIAALSHPTAMRWFASPRPWWALAVMLVALIPHALWLKASGFAMLDYAFDQGGGRVNWMMTLRFALAPFFYWAPGWIACALIFSWAGTGRLSGTAIARLLVKAWRPQGWRDSLFWIAFTPWALSLGFGLLGLVELSTPWAIPIGFAFPLLWLRNLIPDAHEPPLAAAIRQVGSPHLIRNVLLTVLIGSALLATAYALIGQRDYYRPTEALALAIDEDWRARHPGQTLGWSGGAWPDTSMMGFYIDARIRALPGLPDSREASLAPHLRWPDQPGLLLCPSSDCAERMRSWLRARRLDDEGRVIRAQRSGWRFPKASPESMIVFDVPPQRPGDARQR